MRYASWADFQTKHPDEAKVILDHRATDEHLGELYDDIVAGKDIPPRIRALVRSRGRARGKVGELPSLGDVFGPTDVWIWQVYTDEDRGGLRYVFRFGERFAGRFEHTDIRKGRIGLKDAAIRSGFEPESHNKRPVDARDVKAKVTGKVVWIGRSGDGYIILEDIEIEEITVSPAPALSPWEARVPPGIPLADLEEDEREETEPIPGDSSGSGRGGAEEPDEGEASSRETEIERRTEKGAAIPSFTDWRSRLS